MSCMSWFRCLKLGINNTTVLVLQSMAVSVHFLKAMSLFRDRGVILLKLEDFSDEESLYLAWRQEVLLLHGRFGL